jgi:arabinan endo-1,5-alpha-L-arabinosidase
MYCTTDPLNDEDRNAEGFNFHKIPMLRSLDLVNWVYMGDAFSAVPDWGEPTAGIWAPEIDFFDGKYYLYYGITDVKPTVSGALDCGGDSAIGVATSTSPLGPWVDSGAPVVEPRYNGASRPFGTRECNFFWTYDPEVIVAEGQKYIYFGSYYGGVHVRRLTADNLHSDPGSQMMVAISNRYEGPEVIFRNGYYYIFLSVTDCCRGSLTGYSVFAGRSLDPMGPFIDREGVGLISSRAGGMPVLSMNGNRWVGPGHNSVFTDARGEWWTVYHAVDRFDYHFGDDTGFTKRPVLLDPLEWVEDWPMVRGGLWASDTPQPAPAAQAGDPGRNAGGQWPRDDQVRPGNRKAAFSDEFDGQALSSGWTWVRPPDEGTTGFENGLLRFDTQDRDLYQQSNNASVLTRPAPAGEYVVETKVNLVVPADGCCFNYRQAGLVIYANDDRYIKLVHASIWETRQTEFAKEQEEPIRNNEPNRYGNTVVGAPGEWTWLRISKRVQGDEEVYTPYTSRDGVNWVRGGVWTHKLGTDVRIGLVSMGGADYTAYFDYVRVYELHGTAWFPMVHRETAQ